METANLIIEIIYDFANVLFPMALMFFCGGLMYDLTNRRANKQEKKKLSSFKN